MDEVYGQKFDLPGLLKLRDLDIRGIAARNETLSAKEYLNTLSEFLYKAPAVADILNKIAEAAGEEPDFQNLAAAVGLLTNIGSHKLVSDINDVLDAEKRGDEQMAVFRASRVYAEFNEFYKLLMNAKTTGEASNTDANAPANETGAGASLKTVLERLDYEEATRKLRILAVDDASFMLTTIKIVLSSDYEVFALTKATLIERFLRHTTPELFLLDYNMPDISGFELIPIIRSFREHKDTPIIFLTAMGTPEHVKTAVSLGACDYMVKPLNAEILLEKVAKHIVRKKAF